MIYFGGDIIMCLSDIKSFQESGIALFPKFCSLNEIEVFSKSFDVSHLMRPGLRQNNLAPDLVEFLCSHTALNICAQSLIGKAARLVRVLMFDKTPDVNWSVPWHQDRTIAVKKRYDMEGFGPWSVKDGITHVEPPVSFLEMMVVLRLHIDPCLEDNGPLEVIPGSYKFGRLSHEDVLKKTTDASTLNCLANVGDLLAMKGLTIHRSLKAHKPHNRRVLHLEFCSKPLPTPLAWFH